MEKTKFFQESRAASKRATKHTHRVGEDRFLALGARDTTQLCGLEDFESLGSHVLSNGSLLVCIKSRDGCTKQQVCVSSAQQWQPQHAGLALCITDLVPLDPLSRKSAMEEIRRIFLICDKPWPVF